MKKLVKILIFTLVLVSSFILAGCGEKNVKLKALDNIFNDIKTETILVLEANKEPYANRTSKNEVEKEATLKGFEMIEESIKQTTYKVENINDGEIETNLILKLKIPAYSIVLRELDEKYNGKMNKEYLEEVNELAKKLSKKDIPTIEIEVEITMLKENDEWTISQRDRMILKDKIMGLQD